MFVEKIQFQMQLVCDKFSIIKLIVMVVQGIGG